MSKKDVLHIPAPQTPPPGRKAHTEDEERAPSTPPLRPFDSPARGPARGDDPRVIEPQPSSIPYPGVGVS